MILNLKNQFDSTEIPNKRSTIGDYPNPELIYKNLYICICKNIFKRVGAGGR